MGVYSLENYDPPRIPWDPPNRLATAATPSTSCRAHKHANTHGLSKALSQGELGGAWRSQKEPGARRSQGELGGGARRSSQEVPFRGALKWDLLSYKALPFQLEGVRMLVCTFVHACMRS